MFLWLFLNLIIGNYEYLYQVHSIASQMFYKIYIFLFSHNSLENICARVIFWTFRRLQAWKFIKKKFRQSCFRPATVLKTEKFIFQRIWQFYFQEKQCVSLQLNITIIKYTLPMFSKYLFITTLLLRLAIHLTLATNVFNVLFNYIF